MAALPAYLRSPLAVLWDAARAELLYLATDGTRLLLARVHIAQHPTVETLNELPDAVFGRQLDATISNTKTLRLPPLDLLLNDVQITLTTLQHRLYLPGLLRGVANRHIALQLQIATPPHLGHPSLKPRRHHPGLQVRLHAPAGFGG